MSGHNPHSRSVGHAVNSSQWNHLQVPSFIPRQPQLAHMSNERPIRSPLAWHHSATNSAEALYGYMAAAAAAAASNNHKTNPLDINPLLPFVRSQPNAMPFGSVDLSISSANRNSMTPSPRSQTSPAINPNVANHSSTNNVQNIEANASVAPPQESFALIAEMSEQLAALKANPALGLFPRDSQPIEPSLGLVNDRPIDMMKESASEHETSNAPLHQLFGLNPANIPQNLNDLSKSLLTLIGNSSNGLTTNEHLPLKSNAPSLSNDDSLDSQTGACNGEENDSKKNRNRRRKPQKTVRAQNETPSSLPTTPQNGKSSPLHHLAQTQSIDLSNHSMSHEASGNNIAMNKSTNGKSMNGFALPLIDNGPMYFPNTPSHLKPPFYTADLVKKVEEMVKCSADTASNDCNGFAAIPLQSTTSATPTTTTHNQSPPDEKLFSASTNADTKPLDDTAKCNGNENGKIDSDNPNLNGDQKASTECSTNSDEKVLAPNSDENNQKFIEATPFANSTPKRSNGTMNNVKVDVETSVSMIETNEANSTRNPIESSKSEPPNERNECENVDGHNLSLQDKNESQLTPSTSQVNRKRPAPTRKRAPAPKRNNSKNASKTKSLKTNANKRVNDKTKTDKKGSKKPNDEPTTGENVIKFRGPFIRVHTDGSESVVNAPIADEIADKTNKNRKPNVANINDRSKVRGLHVSTLSNRYDAMTTDTTWMCVFCKLGPHKHGLGDLFGPFIVTTDSDDFQESQVDPIDDMFRCKRTKENMTATIAAKMTSPTTTNNSSKKKRKMNDSTAAESSTQSTTQSTPTSSTSNSMPDIYLGMTKVSERAYEVWTHEDCVVWSNGAHIIGTRIVGLEAAVWSSTRHRCAVCQQNGAVVSCLQRGCPNEAHAPCAKQSEWSLDEITFQTRCKLHAI